MKMWIFFAGENAKNGLKYESQDKKYFRLPTKFINDKIESYVKEKFRFRRCKSFRIWLWQESETEKGVST